MSGRYLIINADDFGLCEATNNAIEQIFNEGVVSNTTIMTPCPAADDAAQRANRNKKIVMGLHITTNSEWTHKWGAVLPGGDVPSLLDEGGSFFPTVAEFAAHAKADEVVKEMEAQYSFLSERGIVPTHADSHMGSVYGITGISFMKEALEFCARHRLPFRFPKNTESIKGIIRMNEIPKPLMDAHAQAVGYAQMLGVGLIDNLYTSTLPFEEITSYEILKNFYMKLISMLPEGISEIFMHPSLDDILISKDNPKWQARLWEYKFLLDDGLKKLLEKEGIVLTTYAKAPF